MALPFEAVTSLCDGLGQGAENGCAQGGIGKRSRLCLNHGRRALGLWLEILKMARTYAARTIPATATTLKPQAETAKAVFLDASRAAQASPRGSELAVSCMQRQGPVSTNNGIGKHAYPQVHHRMVHTEPLTWTDKGMLPDRRALSKALPACASVVSKIKVVPMWGRGPELSLIAKV
jgi:hypothetical protein